MSLCWGSFLNVIAYRLVHQVSIWRTRSFCPHCLQTIAWYDNIPLISLLLLRGKCRTCHASISILYPAIELITALLITTLYVTVPPLYFWAYGFFFSALIITIRTDLETMLISRLVTLALIPVGLMLSYFGYLPSSWYESMLGIIIGYGLLWLVARLFYVLTKKEGIGEGDLELMAFIGSFLGPLGCWISLFLGSLFGSIIGIIILILTKQKMIPFGPFLALGAMTYVLLGPVLIHLFMFH